MWSKAAEAAPIKWSRCCPNLPAALAAGRCARSLHVWQLCPGYIAHSFLLGSALLRICVHAEPSKAAAAAAPSVKAAVPFWCWVGIRLRLFLGFSCCCRSSTACPDMIRHLSAADLPVCRPAGTPAVLCRTKWAAHLSTGKAREQKHCLSPW